MRLSVSTRTCRSNVAASLTVSLLSVSMHHIIIGMRLFGVGKIRYLDFCMWPIFVHIKTISTL